MKLRNMTSIFLCHKENILLLYRIGSKVVQNSYIASCGGHFEKEELNDPEQCALREMKEELGLSKEDITDLKLRYITLRYTQGEIRQNYYYFAKLVSNQELHSNEGILKWFSLEELLDLKMPYTTKRVIEHYRKVGKDDDDVYAGIALEEEIDFKKLQDF